MNLRRVYDLQMTTIGTGSKAGFRTQTSAAGECVAFDPIRDDAKSTRVTRNSRSREEDNQEVR